MKKHPFLHVDFTSTVKLSESDRKKLVKWLSLASKVTEQLIRKKVISEIPNKMTVSLLLCGDTRIKKLNHDFRNKNKVTDVLSFPSYENLRKSNLKMNDIFLGDMAICHQQTKRQSKEFNISYFDEFIHLYFHGLLHLMGYDHEISAKEEKLMQEWEEEALKLFSIEKRK